MCIRDRLTSQSPQFQGLRDGFEHYLSQAALPNVGMLCSVYKPAPTKPILTNCLPNDADKLKTDLCLIQTQIYYQSVYTNFYNH